MVRLNCDWDDLLKAEFESDYYLKLREFLKYEYSHFCIYPPMHDIFNALRYTPFEEVKAVIVGQDPYHGAGQAHGLCFSVKNGVQAPPSLQNIFKELSADVCAKSPATGELTCLARQGVLLLNTILTVREGCPQSHRGAGWEILTDKIIELLGKRERPAAFLLWGANARAKKALITNPRHLLLEAPHPSPLSASRGFFGCAHFSKVNEFLLLNGERPIDWDIRVCE